MKTKYLLTALALPALFAACSQEDIFTDANLPQTELLGKIAGDVAFEFNPESRLTWGATGGQVWEENDEFSLFWVNADMSAVSTEEGSVLPGMANALYKKDGNTFTSENILYVGKHLMVYPVNKTHFTNKDIIVEVGATQDANVALGKRSVYTNESLLTIDAMPEKAEDMKEGVIYAAGYKQPVQAMVKPLSSNLVLNLNFDMPSTIKEVTIKSVSLTAKENIFPADGYLTATADKVGFVAKDLKNKIVLKMPEGTKVKKSNSTFTAQIALLPVIADGSEYTIEVSTNYGIVTISKAKYVTRTSDGLYLSAGNTKDIQDDADFELEDNELLDLDEELALTAKNGTEYAYRGVDYEVTEDAASYGKRISANVTVKMTEASIHNMKVADSQELIDAYNTYTLLAKTGPESFILSNEKPFEMTPAAVAKILSNKNITLTQELNDSIKLVGEHTAIPTFIVKENNVKKTLFDVSATKVILGEEGTWALDVDAAAEANAWTEVIVDGALTISESNPTEGAVALAVPVTNRGSVEFSGNVEMPVAYNQTEDGATTIPAASYVDLNDGGSIDGNVTVNGGLYANKGVTYVAEGAAVEVSGSFLTASTGTMHNLGTITLKDKGTAIVTTNEAGEGEDNVKGSIILAARDSGAKVEDDEKAGYIKWNLGNVASFERKHDDAFNTLIIENDFVTDYNEGVKYVEINGTKVNISKKANVDGEGWNLSSVLVNEGKTLVIKKGLDISTVDLENDGRIEVFGSLKEQNVTGKGKIYYYNGQINVDNVEDLKAALTKADLVVLTANMVLDAALEVDRTVTIDLNGKKLYNKTDIWNDSAKEWSLISVVGEKAELTIKGNGELTAKENDCYVVDVREGATLNIEGGKYTGNLYAVYVLKGTANVSGGEFDLAQVQTDEFVSGSEWSSAYSGILNCNDEASENGEARINVTGGKYKNFNPCNNDNNDNVTSYMPASGYHVKCTNSQGIKTEPENRAYVQEWLNAGVTAVYEVIKE